MKGESFPESDTQGGVKFDSVVPRLATLAEPDPNK